MGKAAAGAPVHFEPTGPVPTFATVPAQLAERALLVALRVGGKSLGGKRSGRGRREGDLPALAVAHSSGVLLGQGGIALDGLVARAPLPFRVTLVRHGLPVGVLVGTLQVSDSNGEPLVGE